MNFMRQEIPAQGVFSLCWEEDHLVDWVGGGNRFFLDGKIVERSVNYAYRFDSAKISQSGTYAAIYEKTGTKGLLLKNGDILREFNRSFYQADRYEYPIAFAVLPDGREALIHCPEEYNRIDIEEVESGKRLTDSVERNPSDFFHSRLAISPKGKFLISAGWIWHPVDSLRLWNLEEVLADPTKLDGDTFGFEESLEDYFWDCTAAAFLGEDRLILGLGADWEEIPEPFRLVLCETNNAKPIHSVNVSRQTGTLFAVDANHVVAFYGSPRLLEISTGKDVHEWPDLKTGEQRSSIFPFRFGALPPLALHPSRPMFAVADKEKITIINFE
jgi:hypothetical protein